MNFPMARVGRFDTFLEYRSKPKTETKELSCLATRMQTPSLQNVALGKPVTDGPDFGPSWQVDLGGEHLVRTVVVHYGRELGARLRRLRILTSRDGRRWRTVFRGLDGDSPAPGEPFVAGIEEGPIARHVRVQMDASHWIYIAT